MLKEEPQDTRRFQLLRLCALVDLREQLLQKMREISGWDAKKIHRLIQALDESIDGEFSKLSGSKFSCND
ncbi:hypothetical protein [Megasphaera sueciensis]|uniref:hypothetical protein n=1 Tax=Megasphaera sueciensis TaxID=349094 RepID=UPI003CFD5939